MRAASDSQTHDRANNINQTDHPKINKHEPDSQGLGSISKELSKLRLRTGFRSVEEEDNCGRKEIR